MKRAIILLVLCTIFSGCSVKEIETQTLEKVNSVKNENPILEKVIPVKNEIPISQLENEVISYINANPDEREILINYALNLRMIELTIQNPQAINGGAEFILNSLPGLAGFVGGVVKDNMVEDFLNEYKQTLENATSDYSRAVNTIESNREFLNAKGNGYDFLIKKYSAENLKPETYDAEKKIAQIMYHGFEAMVEENKTRLSLEKPTIWSLLEYAQYQVFEKPENLEQIEESVQVLENIYSALWIDMNRYESEQRINEYYKSIIPKYLFPFEFESAFIPQNENDFEIYETSHSSDNYKKIYALINEEWTSLTTGKKILIYVNPMNENRAEKLRINSIYALGKNQPLAAFNFAGITGRFFITPAVHIKDGKRENVLLMYEDYETLHFNGSENGFGYTQNLRIENIGSAKDVLIRPYEPPLDMNNYDDDKFLEKYYEQVTPNYLFRDRLKISFVPKSEEDMLIFAKQSEEAKKICDTINGEWRSLNSGETRLFNIQAEKIHMTYAIAKNVPFMSFKFEGNQIFVTPVVDRSTGEKVLVMYINYKFVDFNEESHGFGYAQNLRVDNIKSAEDVLIKVSR